MITTDVAIIGGGIAGCAALYYLTRAGVECALLERGKLNRGASGGTAGNLHIQISRHTEGETTWSVDRLGPGELEAHRQEAQLNLAAAEMWSTLETELAADLGTRQPGGLMVADTEAEWRLLGEKCRLENQVGIASQLLSIAEARKIEPRLSPELFGALLCPREGFANALRAAPAFANAARRQGAMILQDHPVLGLERRRGGYRLDTPSGPVAARIVVNAAGSDADRVAAWVGTSLPIRSRYLQVCVTEPWTPTLSHYVAHTTRRLTLKQMPAGQFLLSGGWLGADSARAPGRGRVLAASVRGSAWVAMRVIPALREVRINRAWVARTLYNDGTPTLLGKDPRNPGLVHLVPLTAGFALAPILGLLTAELVTGTKPSLDLDPYRVG